MTYVILIFLGIHTQTLCLQHSKKGILYSSKLESCKALWPLGGTLSFLIVWLRRSNPWRTDEPRKNISKPPKELGQIGG